MDSIHLALFITYICRLLEPVAGTSTILTVPDGGSLAVQHRINIIYVRHSLQYANNRLRADPPTSGSFGLSAGSIDWPSFT